MNYVCFATRVLSYERCYALVWSFGTLWSSISIVLDLLMVPPQEAIDDKYECSLDRSIQSEEQLVLSYVKAW